MSRRWVRIGVVVTCVAGACAKNPPAPRAEVDERPLISADRLGDGDAPEPAAAPQGQARDQEQEDDRYFSPAEHEAMAAQGYEVKIDDRIVTQTRIQPAESADDEPKGPWGRAMDTIGKGFVAVASVLLPLAAAVAPFLLM